MPSSSFSRSQNTESYMKDLERMQQLLGNLRTVVHKGNWEEEYSKPYAELICDEGLRILQRVSDELPEKIFEKRQCGDRNDQEIVSSSSSNRVKPKKVARENPQPIASASCKPNKVARKNSEEMKNSMVIKKEKIDDTIKEKTNYGLKNEKYPRYYNGCTKRGCHEIMCFGDHNNCQHSSVLKDGIN